MIANKFASLDKPETWKDISGFEARYQVSSLGRVRSLDRPVRCTSCRGEELRTAKGKVLSPAKTKLGHLYVRLGRSNRRSIHRLVHEAFIGQIADGLDVAHLDGNPANNTPDNLLAVTRQENNRHVAMHGRRPLTVEQVRTIRGLVNKNTPTKERDAIAAQIGINRRHLNRVARGDSYAYVF